MTAVYICECGHPKSQHKREREGCRSVECAGACAKFVADMAASAAAQGVERAGQPTATVVAAAKAAAEQLPTVGKWPGERDRELPIIVPVAEDTLSTSARLAKAEQERDEARAKVARINDLANECRTVNDALRAELAGCYRDLEATTREREVERHNRLASQAELASARQEIGGLQAQLEQAENYAHDLQDDHAQELADVRSAAEEKVRAVLAAGGVLYAYDAWSCLTEGGCGSRYTMPAAALEHRCGPLTPVRVSITHREEEPTE